jgi:hypothetical protein
VLKAITGAEIDYVGGVEDYEVSYDSVGETLLTYDGTFNTPIVPYGDPRNVVIATVQLNGASRSDVEAYLSLLVPFYIKLLITNWEE